MEFDRGGKARGQASLKTIAFRIAENKMADFLRRKYRDREFNADDYARLFPGEGISPEIRILITEIIDGASKLTSAQSQAFLLCGLAGLDPKEAAEITGFKRQSINRAFSKAKKNLRKRFFEDGSMAADFDQNAQICWLDRFYEAYLKLAIQTGRLDQGLEWRARRIRSAISRSIQNGGFR